MSQSFKDDIESLRRKLYDVTPNLWDGCQVERELVQSDLCLHPYIFSPFGFVEAKIFHEVCEETAEFRRRSGQELYWPGPKSRNYEPIIGGVTKELLLKSEKDGRWYMLDYINYVSKPQGAKIEDLVFTFVSMDGNFINIPAPEVLAKLELSVLGGSDESLKLVFSDKRVPVAGDSENILVSNFAGSLLSALERGCLSLDDLKWQDLEDVVYALLRERGLKVTPTPRLKDGGRDLIAVGELFPGFETTLAIEVKHKKKVGVNDLSQALYRNRNFPCVMLATSGKFTAGVVHESKLPENALRLHLADGDKLVNWIRGPRSFVGQ